MAFALTEAVCMPPLESALPQADMLYQTCTMQIVRLSADVD